MRIFFLSLGIFVLFVAAVLFDDHILGKYFVSKLYTFDVVYFSTLWAYWVFLILILIFGLFLIRLCLPKSESATEWYKRVTFYKSILNVGWIAFILLILSCIFLYVDDSVTVDKSIAAELLFVGVFSAAVGFGELVSRYNDDPGRLLASPPTAVYVCVNMAAGVGALALVKHFGVFPAGPHKAIFEVLLASFGAIAFFRTSFFTARVGQTDIGIGPSTLLKSLLDSSDLMTNREQAAARAGSIANIMPKVDFEKAKAPLPILCFLLVTNSDEKVQKEIAEQILVLGANDSIDPVSKSVILGVYLLRQYSALVLTQAVTTLGPRILRDEKQDGQGASAANAAQQPKSPGQAIVEAVQNFVRPSAPPSQKAPQEDVKKAESGPIPPHVEPPSSAAAAPTKPPAAGPEAVDVDALALQQLIAKVNFNSDEIANLKKIASNHFGHFVLSKEFSAQLQTFKDCGLIDTLKVELGSLPVEGGELSEYLKSTKLGEQFLNSRAP